MEVRIDGLKEMERELLQFPEKLARRSLARAASKGARRVRDIVRQNIDDVGLVGETRQIRKGIRVSKLKTRDWRTTQIYGIRHRGKGWYGKLFEAAPGEMWAFKRQVGNRRHRAHLRRALDEHYEEIANIVKRQLAEEIFILQSGTINYLRAVR